MDDGLHHFAINMAVMEQVFCRLKQGGIYIIEDIVDFDSNLYENFCKKFPKSKVEYKRIKNPLNIIDNNILVVIKG